MQPEILQILYQDYTGHTAESIEPLAGAGSNRKYYRLKGNPQLIGVYGTSEAENRAFLYMAKHFTEKGLPVPQISMTEWLTCKKIWETFHYFKPLNKDGLQAYSMKQKKAY